MHDGVSPSTFLAVALPVRIRLFVVRVPPEDKMRIAGTPRTLPLRLCSLSGSSTVGCAVCAWSWTLVAPVFSCHSRLDRGRALSCCFHHALGPIPSHFLRIAILLSAITRGYMRETPILLNL